MSVDRPSRYKTVTDFDECGLCAWITPKQESQTIRFVCDGRLLIATSSGFLTKAKGDQLVEKEDFFGPQN
jgi:hypothetical protein